MSSAIRQLVMGLVLWARELAGWGLVGLGLFVFFLVWDYCERHLFLEAMACLIMGIFVFRGGIHLLKVAIATRVCQQAQEQLAAPAPGRNQRTGAQR
jgi:hypothetical protein